MTQQNEIKQRMKELAKRLNRASKAYYAQDTEIMSNFEYDALYEELEQLEQESGLILAGSPTRKVGYEAVDYLPKEEHEKPMLSLDKTKDREALKAWLKGQEALLSWKLDGLTVVLTYENGELIKGVTRGNGEVGEVITANVKTFVNVPLQIACKEKLIIRGEAVISYSDFERINASISQEDAKYKNPRNLCSGSVRQLNSEITANRSVHFYAFSLVSDKELQFNNSVEGQMRFLAEQGFDVVEYKRVNEASILDAVEWFENHISKQDVPSDGLVLTLDDIAYGRMLGTTAKFPRNAIAFKWRDEIRETQLLDMEWSPSRTGLINPVAIFEPVELEGTTVSRASVHNVSIVKSLQLGIGDMVTVYKANMIIPQIAENLTRSGTLEIPKKCPVCGGNTEIRSIADAESLYCMNAECEAKKIKAFTHFVERNAMNIDGLSEATLEKFIAKGFIHEFTDIFRLERFREEIVQMEGFGEKSYENLIKSVNDARKVSLPNFINALGIQNIGLANAKVLCKYFSYDFSKMCEADAEEISEIDGIGEVIATAFSDYMKQDKNVAMLKGLLEQIEFTTAAVPEAGTQTLNGKVFVVTGSLEHFANRDALKERIEELGGKVTGSVTGKTTALINNDTTSMSSKNKKAKELGIPVISEEDFMSTYLS